MCSIAQNVKWRKNRNISSFTVIVIQFYWLIYNEYILIEQILRVSSCTYPVLCHILWSSMDSYEKCFRIQWNEKFVIYITLQISIDYFLFIVYHSVHVLKFTKNTYITKERRFSLQKSYKRYLAPLIQHRLYGTKLQKRNHMTALAPTFYPLMLCCTLFLICISLLDY